MYAYIYIYIYIYIYTGTWKGDAPDERPARCGVFSPSHTPSKKLHSDTYPIEFSKPGSGSTSPRSAGALPIQTRAVIARRVDAFHDSLCSEHVDFQTHALCPKERSGQPPFCSPASAVSRVTAAGPEAMACRLGGGAGLTRHPAPPTWARAH